MVRVDSKLPDGYRLISTAPAVIDHLMLRERAGLSPMGRRQAEAGLRGSWTACHVVHEPSGETVAMGRIIGDGGCFFQVVDMAVLPQHQRRGLGDAVLAYLLDRIRVEAPPGAYVSLLADRPGRRLYAKHGFRETAPSSIGMALRLG
jgi:GNAT superfamily N-acetyltransferase